MSTLAAWAALAAPAATGCAGDGCPTVSNAQGRCANDHELVTCSGDPNDLGGQHESTDPCPSERPFCQEGACVSLTPLMCIDDLIATSAGTDALAVADLDGDGHEDVAFTDSGELRVALARADGTFAPGASVSSVSSGWRLANLDGDGIPDLLLGGGVGEGVTVAHGTGHAAFGPAQPLPGVGGVVVAVADVDGDGTDDIIDDTERADLSEDFAVHLAAAGFARGEALHFLPGDGVRGVVLLPLQAARRWALGIAYAQSVDLRAIGGLGTVLSTIAFPVAPADYDGDGNTDVILGGLVALGDGQGAFARDPSRSVGTLPLATADLDGDGHPDLIRIDAVNSTSTHFLKLHGTGDGHFTASAPILVERSIASSPVPIHVAGRPGTDLVVVAGGQAGHEIRILRGDCL